ncbi:MAG: tetratricopeptide repeat protein [Lutibacter sp.]|uniref:tetratricopeptide repeat-containing sensor histidine kinase n=1 Tax=Lutibacter sp. TaxID=1925666 RepID=UPI00385A6A1B
MKVKFHNTAVGYLFCYCSFLMLSCKNDLTFNKNKNSVKHDSITRWIQQSKNRKLDVNSRERILQKAYNYTNILSTDSIKNKYYSKIAFEADNLNDVTLFKKVNFQALILSKKLRDTFKIGDAHWNYASYYFKSEVFDSAYYHYHEAYKNFKLIKHEYYTAKMLYNMGFIQGRLKDYTGSEVLIFEALTIFKKLNKNLNIYNCYNYLGLVYMELEEYDKAIYYHNKSLEYLEKVKNKRKSILKEGSLSNLGLVYQKLKDYHKSIENFERALENNNLKSRNVNLYARLIDNIAYTKFLDGDSTNVIEDLYKAFKIRDSIHNLSGVVISKRHLSEFYALKRDTLKAVKLANEALSLANKVENNRDKLESLLLLSKVDKLNASNYLSNYVHLNDSLQVEERKIRNKFTRIRFETDEYIVETEKLSQQKVLIIVGSFLTILMLSLAYFLKVQRTKNKELLFEREQQKSNEEIFSLMLKQQSKLEEGRLKERHRISEDLHDGVLGKIFGTRIGLGFLTVNENDSKKQQFYIDELQNIEKEIRAISHELKSDILSSKVDFYKIIENLIEQKSTLGNFECEMNADKEIYWDKISDKIKINLYRIIQEALQNCIKYSKANRVDIQFELLDYNTLNLFIKDNGIGFNINEKRKGIGLKNMQSRVSKLKGVFEVNSIINKGTTIFVSCSI